jgi:hypothetical protein
MCIVVLKDGTTYNIDTDNTSKARDVVEYKLRQRLDRRVILLVNYVKGATCDRGKYYNSSNPYDGEDLKCTSGWSYKW